MNTSIDNNVQQINGLSTSRKVDWLGLIGLVIPIASALGYALALTYESAYFDYYKIPNGLIDLKATTILFAIAAIFGGVVLLVWWFFTLFLTSKETRIGPVAKRVYFLVITFFLLFFYSFKYLMSSEASQMLGVFLVYSVFFFFLFPLLTQKHIRGYRNKLIEEDKRLKARDPGVFYQYIIIVIGLLAFLLTTAHYGGRAEAGKEKAFYAPRDFPNSVILRIYSDRIICADVEEIGLFKQNYFVLKTVDGQKLVYVGTGFMKPVP